MTTTVLNPLTRCARRRHRARPRGVRRHRLRDHAHRARDEVGAEVVEDVHRRAHARRPARRPGPPLRDVRSPGRMAGGSRVGVRRRAHPRALHQAHVLGAEIAKPRSGPVRLSGPSSAASADTHARSDRLSTTPFLRATRRLPDGPPVQRGHVQDGLPRRVLARHQTPELLQLGLHGGLVHARIMPRGRPSHRRLRAKPAHGAMVP